jgi:hypothetical protein
VVNATPRPLEPRKRPSTHCIGGWVGSRPDLDGCGKSRPAPTGIRSPDRPGRRESLHRLNYPGPSRHQHSFHNSCNGTKTLPTQTSAPCPCFISYLRHPKSNTFCYGIILIVCRIFLHLSVFSPVNPPSFSPTLGANAALLPRGRPRYYPTT